MNSEWIIFSGIGGIIGFVIGNVKGRPLAGFFLGLLIGPIGWIVTACGPNPKKEAAAREAEALAERRHRELLAATRGENTQRPRSRAEADAAWRRAQAGE